MTKWDQALDDFIVKRAFSAQHWQAVKEAVSRLKCDADEVLVDDVDMNGQLIQTPLRNMLEAIIYSHLMEMQFNMPSRRQLIKGLVHARAKVSETLHAMTDWGVSICFGLDMRDGARKLDAARNEYQTIIAALEIASQKLSERIVWIEQPAAPQKNAEKARRNRFLEQIAAIYEQAFARKATGVPDGPAVAFLQAVALPVLGSAQMPGGGLAKWLARRRRRTR